MPSDDGHFDLLADEARVQYDKVIRDYPGTPTAAMAAQRMGRLPPE